MTPWTVSPEWKGETAFLVCSGPSVNGQNIDGLRGRRVVAVNSSCRRVPWADMLFFGDERWGRANADAIKAFAGRVISARHSQSAHQKVTYLSRPKPSETPVGLSSDPSEVWFRFTSVRGAINLLCHLGVSVIVTLGLDGGPDAKGRTHHHEPHPWNPASGIWDKQIAELSTIVTPLEQRGIRLLNASPGSRVPFWPIISLEDIL